jgi:3-oxoacyl-[acyl-carrier-protein] synthase III
MNLSFSGKSISGVLTILPSKEIVFEDEIDNYNFSRERSLKLKSAMGFNKRRIVENGVCVSDLCIFGLNYLFDKGKLKKEEIDALILVTQTPDYILPPTSNVIQGALGLNHDVICLDINQGCAGYIIGLNQAFMLLEQKNISKVVLLNADILSSKVSKNDRNSNPLIGDGASITIVEKSSQAQDVNIVIKMNGEGAFSLQIPAGGARLPISDKTGILNQDTNGNLRSLNHLVMKGDEVFNFVQTEVPPLIDNLLILSNTNKDEIDYYMFHQPNKFMLHKLADKMGVPREKMPANIVENFGNSSGVTIPTSICYNIGDKLLSNDYKLCLSGFGVGLTWAAMTINLGKLNFCEIIDFN